MYKYLFILITYLKNMYIINVAVAKAEGTYHDI